MEGDEEEAGPQAYEDGPPLEHADGGSGTLSLSLGGGDRYRSQERSGGRRGGSHRCWGRK